MSMDTDLSLFQGSNMLPERGLDSLLPKEYDISELKQVAKDLNPKNFESLISYGFEIQANTKDFSQCLLEHSGKKDIEEIGNVVEKLTNTVKEISMEKEQFEKQPFFKRIFGKKHDSVQEQLSKFQKATIQVERLIVRLDRYKTSLLKDIVILESLNERNKTIFQTLDLYIAGGQQKLMDISQEIALNSPGGLNDFIMPQENDLKEYVELLEKRMYNLKITREITVQSAFQIRMMQHTNKLLCEKIQTAIMSTIPLWKNEVAITMNFLRKNQATQAQRQLSKLDDAPAENGVGELDRWDIIQKKLLSHLEETKQIQESGRIELNQMKEKLENLAVDETKDM